MCLTTVDLSAKDSIAGIREYLVTGVLPRSASQSLPLASDTFARLFPIVAAMVHPNVHERATAIELLGSLARSALPRFDRLLTSVVPYQD